MAPSLSYWQLARGTSGRFMSMVPHTCPSGAHSELGLINIPMQVIQTAATVGIWYELHELRLIQDQLMAIKAAEWEERRLQWVAMAIKAWIDAHSEQAGLDYSTTIALKKELIKIMQKLSENEKMDVPQVLLSMAQGIQRGLFPRVKLAFKIARLYNGYAHLLAESSNFPDDRCFSKSLKYLSGSELTDRWLSSKSLDEAKSLEEEYSNSGWFSRHFGSGSDKKEEMEILKKQRETTMKYKPFQNLIHELSNVLYIIDHHTELSKLIPPEYRIELMLVPETKIQWLFWKKPVIDNDKNTQSFKLIGISPEKSLL